MLGSSEEVEDLKAAYMNTGGSIGEIMTYIPHSTYEDEARFIIAISGLIKQGALSSLDTWESSMKDEKSKLVRRKRGEKEAKEAEELARELGVWEEFYGNGERGEQKGKGKGKGKGKAKSTTGDEGGDEDYSVLQALILKKKEKNMDGFFESLAAKYVERGKGKKRGLEADSEENASPKKQSRRSVQQVPDIDDQEFERLQEKLFGEKRKASPAQPKAKKRQARKAR